ncbi:DUF669 domain-containing protein [Planctomicrobium sp. SH661]|uniref:DUF669 domain-containing protein n=1 Tax=Planctomicrobium sp. SH661 TaxID=3448124 RepID=UPI003F5AE2DD
MAALNFDAQTVEPNDSFDPIPNGDYLCIITTSEMKPTKAGDGAYLELELQVIEGPYQGRKLWDRLNLNNANETTVKIAKGTLSAICRAVGVLQPKDSCELHDLSLVAKVACKKRDDTEELTNVIKSYKKRDAVAQNTTPPAGAPRSGAQAQSAHGGPPWKRA